MPVTILDAWASEGDYYTNGATFSPSAGSNRAAIITISAEKNGSGPIAVSSVTLGGQTLTEVFDIVVGDSGAYHNLLWMGYLNEAGIAAMSGSTITINWSNDPDPGPFGNSKVHYASYQNVDQANINSGSNSATNTATASLAPGQIDVDVDEKCIVAVTGGQPNAPAPAAGYTEESEEVGPANDHSSSANHRTATTNDDTHNPTFTLSASTRMAVAIMALGFSSASEEQEGFRFYDDGTESGSSALEAQDTDITIGKETTFQARDLINATGDPASAQYQKEYKETGDGAGEWRKVPTS